MNESKEDKPFDPFEAWREMRNVGMEAWAKAITQAVNSEEYAKASGAMLDAYLAASLPFREMLEKTMTQALQQANMPTRTDLISLAERLTNVEMRLDDLDAKLDELTKQPANARNLDKRLEDLDARLGELNQQPITARNVEVSRPRAKVRKKEAK
jgi:polyhydroxyalkanoic acid synthase PhaR subunit